MRSTLPGRQAVPSSMRRRVGVEIFFQRPSAVRGRRVRARKVFCFDLYEVMLLMSGRLDLTTLREFTMLHVMNSLTDKLDWEEKVRSVFNHCPCLVLCAPTYVLMTWHSRNPAECVVVVSCSRASRVHAQSYSIPPVSSVCNPLPPLLVKFTSLVTTIL